MGIRASRTVVTAEPAVVDQGGGQDGVGQPEDGVNEVRLVGRVSAAPQTRTLPSGSEVVLFRLVVRRTADRRGEGGPSVDTIDVACWSGRARQRARALRENDGVEVVGSLRRRFFRGSGGLASRYEVEAISVRRHRR